MRTEIRTKIIKEEKKRRTAERKLESKKEKRNVFKTRKNGISECRKKERKCR